MQRTLDFPPAQSRSGSGFHPAVQAWFDASFSQPTPVQAQAWAVTTQQQSALIAAPTGSGKTLAAFLAAINDLVQEGLGQGLRDQVYVLYISPLRALSNDIQRNLQAPLAGIREQLAALGYPDVPIRDAVRTGDTTASEREQMRRTPPHILVTTPESLYILLTSDSGRAMLAGVRSVIVDELHAMAGSKRGAHLMLSLERLCALCPQEPVRIGLSATQKPIEAMAEFLMGQRPPCAIVDTGHVRQRDLALELPRSRLETVISHEVWGEIYDRLAGLAQTHRTTLIFVNTRTQAERVARHLAERLGTAQVTAHHGSLSKAHRFDAEQRLKAGQLRALVTTSALELGIDIGDVDLVCQLGPPRSIAAFLQRVGRSGHAVGAVPKGRLFPLSMEDLVESVALLEAVQRGELDRIVMPRAPRDVLAQQIVGEVACREWSADALLALCQRAAPYRELSQADFDAVIEMLAEGFSTRRGRRAAHLHWDAVNRVLRPRRGAKLTAVTNAGVIPDQFDYDVYLSPEGHRVGSLNEDFAFESAAGDIFQLGNHSYRILKVETGKVFVQDAQGQPPTIPFWFGEAPGRTTELSAAVSGLLQRVETWLTSGVQNCESRMQSELHLPLDAARQLTEHLAAARAALTALPTLDTIILERFFDEAGDTHLVIHSAHGSRINRAWGLALRKRFCRQFNFELQASALEDSIILSLGPTHSFPLEDIPHYLKSVTVQEVLTQALLDAPMFGTRWRWAASIALALRRTRNGQRIAPQLQRMASEDLLAVVFPDQLACAENLTGGYREIPEHPLVQQTLQDCLHDTMDIEGLTTLLTRLEQGELRVICRDLTAPSSLSAAILNARPYAFLDDGAAEERRTHAVRLRQSTDPQAAADLGRLDTAAIARVREEAWPEVRDAEELHDALMVSGFFTTAEIQVWNELWRLQLQAQRRLTALPTMSGETLWAAAERAASLQAALDATEAHSDVARIDLLRSRLEVSGPVSAAQLAAPLGLSATAVAVVLAALEQEGTVMRLPVQAGQDLQWCERRLLHRIHRYSLNQRRQAVRAVAPQDFMRFLVRWHQLGEQRREGEQGLRAVLGQLEGFAVPAAAWELDILPARVRNYLPHLLDRLCASGQIGWWRPSPGIPADAEPLRRSGPVRTTPIVLAERQSLRHWQRTPPDVTSVSLSTAAQAVHATLKQQGALFFNDLLHERGLLRAEVEQGLGELVAAGLVTCDSFAGLRALIVPASRRSQGTVGRRAHRRGSHAIDEAGRWTLQRAMRTAGQDAHAEALADPAVDHIARALLRRYGVVFRKLLEREDHLPPWRELFYVYRRLEARGEIAGGRFVQGFSGEQYALPEAAGLLRQSVMQPEMVPLSISAADPLNLLGILLPGDKVPALPGNRLLLRDGKVIAVQTGGEVRYLDPVTPEQEWDLRNTLLRQARHTAFVAPSPQVQ